MYTSHKDYSNILTWDDFPEGRSIIHYLVLYNHKEMLRHVISECAKHGFGNVINIVDKYRVTPLLLLMKTA